MRLVIFFIYFFTFGSVFNFKTSVRIKRRFQECRRSNRKNRFAEVVLDAKMESNRIRGWNMRSSFHIPCMMLTNWRVTFRKVTQRLEFILDGDETSGMSRIVEEFQFLRLKDFFRTWAKMFGDLEDAVYAIEARQLTNLTELTVEVLRKRDLRVLEKQRINFIPSRLRYILNDDLEN